MQFSLKHVPKSIHAHQKLITFINNAEDLDINTLMYNLLDCSNNYSITGNLWNFYRDKVNDDENENNVPGDYGIISNKIATSRSIQ